jgi:Predicted transcriptional regulators
MVYKISQVADLIGVSAHTLRYYDKEGLLPYVERNKAGVRKFKESDLNWLKIISCLKNTGMSLKQIKEYVDLGMIGDSTTLERLDIMRKHKEIVLIRLQEIENNLATINQKIMVYENRIK